MNILITAGPTREAIDSVRFLTNHSSGKMGFAIAEAAKELGHKVTLIAGPVTITPPEVDRYIAVVSASDMAEAVHANSTMADVVIMTAAVADYRPVQKVVGKLKKQNGNLALELERTEDILKSLGANKRPGQILVGFAAECENVIPYAKEKLQRKNLDFIAANDVSRSDRGFGADDNEITLIGKSGIVGLLPLQNKRDLAFGFLRLILPEGCLNGEKEETK